MGARERASAAGKSLRGPHKCRPWSCDLLTSLHSETVLAAAGGEAVKHDASRCDGTGKAIALRRSV